jgi:hypothetical protein
VSLARVRNVASASLQLDVDDFDALTRGRGRGRGRRGVGRAPRSQAGVGTGDVLPGDGVVRDGSDLTTIATPGGISSARSRPDAPDAGLEAATSTPSGTAIPGGGVAVGELSEGGGSAGACDVEGSPGDGVLSPPFRRLLGTVKEDSPRSGLTASGSLDSSRDGDDDDSSGPDLRDDVAPSSFTSCPFAVSFEDPVKTVRRGVAREFTLYPMRVRASAGIGEPQLVLRRYRDFQRLYDVLAPVAKVHKIKLPPFPSGGPRM